MSVSPVVHYDHEVTIWHMEQEIREKDAEIARLKEHIGDIHAFLADIAPDDETSDEPDVRGILSVTLRWTGRLLGGEASKYSERGKLITKIKAFLEEKVPCSEPTSFEEYDVWDNSRADLLREIKEVLGE